jgi:hypothetical protein
MAAVDLARAAASRKRELAEWRLPSQSEQNLAVPTTLPLVMVVLPPKISDPVDLLNLCEVGAPLGREIIASRVRFHQG